MNIRVPFIWLIHLTILPVCISRDADSDSRSDADADADADRDAGAFCSQSTVSRQPPAALAAVPLTFDIKTTAAACAGSKTPLTSDP